MSKYTRFPEEKYYIQSSPEIHELVMAFADKHNITVLDISRRGGYSEEDPYLCFSRLDNCICRAGSGYGLCHTLVSLSDWIAMFKEPKPAKPPIDYKRELLTAIETICNEYKQKHNL